MNYNLLSFSEEYGKVIYENYIKRSNDIASELYLRKAVRSS